MKLYKHMQPIEVAMVSYLLSLLRERGYSTFTADDGDDPCQLIGQGSLHTALEVVNSVEDSTITTRGPRGELFGIRFILGNGADIISDWAGAETFNEIVDTAIEAFGESRDLYRWGFWVNWNKGDDPFVLQMPEIYSKRVNEDGNVIVGEVTIKPWLGEDDTPLEFHQWVEDFVAALNHHPARPECVA